MSHVESDGFTIHDQEGSELNQMLQLSKCILDDKLFIVLDKDSIQEIGEKQKQLLECSIVPCRFVPFKKEKFLPISKDLTKGLNFVGICNNCKSDNNNNAVYIQKGFGQHWYNLWGTGTYDLSKERCFAYCPKCPDKKPVDITNCIFWDCFFSVEGMKLGENEPIKIKERAPADQGLSFDSNDEIIQWKYLQITTSRTSFLPNCLIL